MITLSAADLAVLGLFAAAVLVAGFSASRRDANNAAGFLLAGRPLTLPLFVMTLVSTWYGGVLGVGEFSYRFGISNWVTQGLPYYLFAALFAWFLAPRIRDSNLFTIPDKLHAAYGRRTALLGSFLTLLLVSPAPYLLMLGLAAQVLFGWEPGWGMAAAALLSASYLFTGGFRADVRTDVVEFLVMFAGFGVILPWCIAGYGGFEFLQERLPSLHLTWHGGHEPQYLLVWFLIALWTFVDPSFHQRCYAARDARTARRGIAVSIGFWFLFDTMTLATGLYARAILPGLDDPVMAYPLLAETVLPPGVKGLFFAGVLATVLSTLNTTVFLSAQTIGRDLIMRLRRTDGPDSGGGTDPSARWTKVGLVAALAAAFPMAAYIPSVIGLWYAVGTVTIPGLVVPVLCAWSDRWRLEGGAAFLSMAAGWGCAILWWSAGAAWSGGTMPAGGPFLGVEPIYPGLAASVLAAAPGLRRRARSRTPGGAAG